MFAETPVFLYSTTSGLRNYALDTKPGVQGVERPDAVKISKQNLLNCSSRFRGYGDHKATRNRFRRAEAQRLRQSLQSCS